VKDYFGSYIWSRVWRNRVKHYAIMVYEQSWPMTRQIGHIRLQHTRNLDHKTTRLAWSVSQLKRPYSRHNKHQPLECNRIQCHV
jgi:hypothetical protein